MRLYIWSQWNGKNLYQIGSLLVILLSAGQFAGEESKKTMGFLLTRPVSRGQVLLGKVGAAILILFIILATGAGAIWLFSQFFRYQAAWERIFTAGIISLV